MVCLHFVFISEKGIVGRELALVYYTRIPSLRENSVIFEGVRGVSAVGGATSRRVGRRASSARRRSIRCGSSGADAKEDEGDRTRVC